MTGKARGAAGREPCPMLAHTWAAMRLLMLAARHCPLVRRAVGQKGQGAFWREARLGPRDSSHPEIS